MRSSLCFSGSLPKLLSEPSSCSLLLPLSSPFIFILIKIFSSVLKRLTSTSFPSFNAAFLTDLSAVSLPFIPLRVETQPYMPAVANSMTYPNASMPVVGITPSQMVANVFCSATGSTGGGTIGVGTGPKTGTLCGGPSTFPNLSGGFASATFSNQPASHGLAQNSLPSTTTVASTCVTQNGTMTSGSGSTNNWPMEGLQQSSLPDDAQEAERFEAKWAALESKSQTKAPNPFSNDLQKTFEIEL